MSNIKVEEISDPEGYRFTMESSDPDYKDAEIVVEAEHDGHGCLFDIHLPKSLSTDYKPMHWLRPKDKNYKHEPKMEDFLVLLNYILKKWNYSQRIVKHLEVEEI